VFSYLWTSCAKLLPYLFSCRPPARLVFTGRLVSLCPNLTLEAGLSFVAWCSIHTQSLTGPWPMASSSRLLMLHKYTEHFLRLVCLVKASWETKGNISLVDHVASGEQAGFQPRFSALPLEEPITIVFKIILGGELLIVWVWESAGIGLHLRTWASWRW
jgi:hypothetical protein